MAIDVQRLLEGIITAATISEKELFHAIKTAYSAVREEELSTIPERIDAAESLNDILDLVGDVCISRMYDISCRYDRKAISIIINIQDREVLTSFKTNLFKAIGQAEISNFCHCHRDFLNALDCQLNTTQPEQP